MTGTHPDEEDEVTKPPVHGVFAENTEETAKRLPAQLSGPERCGAKTRHGSNCARFPAAGRARCRLHGGASTGPRTPEGRQRVGDAARARYVAASIADGWAILPEHETRLVKRLLERLRNSRNGTAQALGITPHGLRRILTGLPLRPQEFQAVCAATGLWI